MKKIVIVGAGFSGLSLAYFLNQKGRAVTIIEKNSKPGGMIATQHEKWGLVESAANGFLNTPQIERFLQSISADYLGSSQNSKKRFIFRDRPRRWPFSFSETLRLGVQAFRFLWKSKVQRLATPEETVENWVNRNFFQTVSDYLLGPAFQGIYASDAKHLSADLVINPLLTRKKEKKLSRSSLFSGREGMGAMMQSLAAYLQDRGVEIRYDAEWSPADQADHTVFATSPTAALSLLQKIESVENAQHNISILRNIETVPLVTITCFFEKPPERYKGFGILFPRAEKVRPLGVLMNTVIFERGSENHSETWIFGGAADREVLQFSDADLKSMILQEREKVLASSAPMLDLKVTRWPQALAHYTVQHDRQIKSLRPMRGYSLHGNYLGAIGLSRILEKSEKLAETL